MSAVTSVFCHVASVNVRDATSFDTVFMYSAISGSSESLGQCAAMPFVRDAPEHEQAQLLTEAQAQLSEVLAPDVLVRAVRRASPIALTSAQKNGWDNAGPDPRRPVDEAR